jgi:hypothetical protein
MRIYFDENFSPSLVAGIQKLQAGRRSDGITVHSVIDEFGKGAPDEKWIPGMASQHGCVITQDLNIKSSESAMGAVQAKQDRDFLFQAAQERLGLLDNC